MPKLLLINPMNKELGHNKKYGKKGGIKMQPLGLACVAAMTPKNWEVELIDENIGEEVDYRQADIVGITAFTSQVNRAYEIVTKYNELGVYTVLGGIHPTYYKDEALNYAKTVVTYEAEDVWEKFISDFESDCPKRVYEGNYNCKPAMPDRNIFNGKKYMMHSIQLRRGCPCACDFCSVSHFNGAKLRHRDIDEVIQEIKGLDLKKSNMIAFVDDNLVGISDEDKAYTKRFMKRFMEEGLHKKTKWWGMSTINVGADKEMLNLMKKCGCMFLFIGFETTNVSSLKDLRKGNLFSIKDEKDYEKLIKNIHDSGIEIMSSFICGFDSDTTEAFYSISNFISTYKFALNSISVYTPFPGTPLFKRMMKEDRIQYTKFPEDWVRYTTSFKHPVIGFKNLTHEQMLLEGRRLLKRVYSYKNIFVRSCHVLKRTRSISFSLLVFFMAINYRQSYWSINMS